MTEVQKKDIKKEGRKEAQRPVPVCGGRPHRQRGDGADGLAVRVSPQPPPLRLQVGQVQRVGRVPHAAPVFSWRRKRSRTGHDECPASAANASLFFSFLVSGSISSGGEAEEVGEWKFLHRIIKKKVV